MNKISKNSLEVEQVSHKICKNMGLLIHVGMSALYFSGQGLTCTKCDFRADSREQGPYQYYFMESGPKIWTCIYTLERIWCVYVLVLALGLNNNSKKQ